MIAQLSIFEEPAPEAAEESQRGAYPACECLEKVNAQLPSNQQIKRQQTISMTTGKFAYLGAQIQTEALGGSRKDHKTVLASFCPFCGTAYTKYPKQWEEE